MSSDADRRCEFATPVDAPRASGQRRAVRRRTVPRRRRRRRTVLRGRRDLSLWYGGSSGAERTSRWRSRSKQITAFIGPSGCGKSTLLRCFNRLNDLIDGVRIDGDILFDGAGIYDPEVDVNAPAQARSAWCSRSRIPFPKSIYENVAYGCRIHGVATEARARRDRRAQPPAAALWDEVKDRLQRERARALRRPAAAPLHRPRDRRRAGGDPARRALLGARPDRHGARSRI